MADNELILTNGLKEMTWTPQEIATVPFTFSGGINVELGKPFFSIRCVYGPGLTKSEWKALRAWIGRRRGAKSPFRAFHAMNRTPDGGATSCTITADGSGTIDITMSPAPVPGDFVAYDVTAGGRAVHEISENVSGNTWDVFPPADKAGGANASCVDAAGEFRLDPSSVRMKEVYDPKNTVSFEARQEKP